MAKYSITGHSKLVDEKENIWGFVVSNGDKEETLLSDNYFSSSIVIAIDEITSYLRKNEVKEGQKVTITLETED